MVIVAMFFIYSNISSPERVVYYKGNPSFFTKFGCIVKGGAIEKVDNIKGYDALSVIEQNNQESGQAAYVCHYH